MREFGAPTDDRKLLWQAAVLALLLESLILLIMGLQHHWLAHPQRTTGLDETKFIEAERYELPVDAEVLTAPKEQVVQAKSEPVLAKHPDAGQALRETPVPAHEEANQTAAAPAAPANHGPVVVYGPTPVIPEYLRDQDINASVVIEFLVNSLGHAVAHLLSSSGNDELDAIALKTVAQWQFRPAENDHKPVDAKLRLRIQFEVK